jgi:nucleotide-binding universal stress UspA family protein
MYDKILVPLDGSAFSERALSLTIPLARALGATVILMRAASASAFPGADPTEAQCQAVGEAQAYLGALATGLSDQGLSCEAATPYGDAAECILLEIGLRDPDFVVMCTHGRSGLGRWIYGSVAEQVVAHSPAPVLLVRPTGQIPTLKPGPEQSSLLVPLDGSAFAEAALPHAEAFARAIGADILLLRALEPPVISYEYAVTGLMADSLEEQRRQAESYLHGVAQKLRNDGLEVRMAVWEGWPADVIVHRGVDSGSRLIVMATHGRTGVARLLLGSVALEVVRRTLLPVLLVRPSTSADPASI